MSKIQTLLGNDYENTPQSANLVYYPGEEKVVELKTREQAEAEWEMSKFTDEQIKDEYNKRFPF